MSVTSKTVKLKERDRCRLVVDWGSGAHKGKVCQIVGFQQHGTQTFVRVMWCGADANKLRDEYGVLFSEEELVRV